MNNATEQSSAPGQGAASALAAPARERGTVVDVFCGAGGLSHGFMLEGFDVRAGIDIDASCRHAYEHNNGARFIEKNIADVHGAEVGALFAEGQPRILVGCAPCQPFSPYSRKRADDKWRLLGEFARLVRETQPDVLSMENVPRLANFHGGELLRGLEDAGYAVWSRVVDCAAYGVPQTRQRLVVLASRVGPIALVPPTHKQGSYRTVRDAIAGLPPIAAGKSAADDPLHRASRLSAVNLARIRAAQPGKTWRDWDASLVADCHRKDSGRWYQSVYGRMSWEVRQEADDGGDGNPQGADARDAPIWSGRTVIRLKRPTDDLRSSSSSSPKIRCRGGWCRRPPTRRPPRPRQLLGRRAASVG